MKDIFRSFTNEVFQQQAPKLTNQKFLLPANLYFLFCNRLCLLYAVSGDEDAGEKKKKKKKKKKDEEE